MRRSGSDSKRDKRRQAKRDSSETGKSGQGIGSVWNGSSERQDGRSRLMCIGGGTNGCGLMMQRATRGGDDCLRRSMAWAAGV
jgi:hypothetical protein